MLPLSCQIYTPTRLNIIICNTSYNSMTLLCGMFCGLSENACPLVLTICLLAILSIL